MRHSLERLQQFRAGRPYEITGYARQTISEMPDEIKGGMLAMTNRVNFFTMLDERDSAQAIEEGSDSANFEGSHALFINDSPTTGPGSNRKLLAELFYPDVKTFKKPLVGD